MPKRYNVTDGNGASVPSVPLSSTESHVEHTAFPAKTTTPARPAIALGRPAAILKHHTGVLGQPNATHDRPIATDDVDDHGRRGSSTHQSRDNGLKSRDDGSMLRDDGSNHVIFMYDNPSFVADGKISREGERRRDYDNFKEMRTVPDDDEKENTRFEVETTRMAGAMADDRLVENVAMTSCKSLQRRNSVEETSYFGGSANFCKPIASPVITTISRDVNSNAIISTSADCTPHVTADKSMDITRRVTITESTDFTTSKSADANHDDGRLQPPDDSSGGTNVLVNGSLVKSAAVATALATGITTNKTASSKLPVQQNGVHPAAAIRIRTVVYPAAAVKSLDVNGVSVSSEDVTIIEASSRISAGGKDIFEGVSPLVERMSGEEDDVTEEDGPPVILLQDTGETFIRIALEIVLPFMMAGFGCVFAGVVLDVVQHWKVFNEVSEVFILVPALLGLKGNLEMTLASRLSTQANLGHMDTTAERLKMIGGNLALTQVQAVVVGFLASMLAIILGWIPARKFDLLHGFLLCSTSVVTASVASLVLGAIMVGVVMFSRKCHINPDNIATPFGGALGDLMTISLLSFIIRTLFDTLESHVWLCPTLLSIWLAMAPIWWTVAYKSKYTKDILYTGWMPVVGAMAISSGGGLILGFVVKIYEGIAVFQPVVNGVGGNLVAVQASRLATALHRVTVPGNLPANAVQGCPNFISTFASKSTSGKTARALMLMVIPGHLIFMFTVQAFSNGRLSITYIFVIVFLVAAFIQVVILLYLANWIVYFMWRRGSDPDNYTIPYLTAIGDLLGGALLALAFYVLDLLGDTAMYAGHEQPSPHLSLTYLNANTTSGA